MLYRSEDSKNCLFCNEDCNEATKNNKRHDFEDLDECSCHSHPSSFLGSLPFKWEDNRKFRAHLKYVFVLRKMLDYPRDKCVQYLRQRCLKGDGGVDADNVDHDGWFSACSKCSELLEEGHGIHHKTEALELQLRELKRKLKETIVEAHKLDRKNDGRGKDDESMEDATIHEEVRHHLAQNDELNKPLPDHSIVKMEMLGPSEDSNVSDENMEGGYGTENENDWVENSASDNESSPNVDEENSEEIIDNHADVKPLDSNSEAADFKQKFSRGSLKSRKASEKVKPEGSMKRPKKRDEDEDWHDDSVSLSEKDDDIENSDSDRHRHDDCGSYNNFRCRVCRAVYVTKKRLREHESLHSLKSGIFKCKKCPFVCRTERGLLTHDTKIHKERSEDSQIPKKLKLKKKKNEEQYPCSYCVAIYKTAHRLKEHEELHSRDDVLKCDYCEYVCLVERGMKIHVTKFHKEEAEEKVKVQVVKEEISQTIFSCNICSASYKDRKRWKGHMQLHRSEDALKCLMCTFVCQTRRNMKVHIGRVHKDTIKKHGPFNCSICPAIYQTSHRFREHMSLHKGSSSISCTTCGWVFSSQEKCDHHVELRHLQRVKKPSSKRRNIYGGGEPFQCEHCPLVYKDRYRFKEHVQIYHKDKLLACDLCEQSYESQRILGDHKKICKGPLNDDDDIDIGKILQCEHCDTTFNLKSKLKRHMESEHPTYRYECLYCDAVFPSETKRRFHMSRSHEDLHNVCKTCGYKAHGASQLNLHMQKHTREKNYMCEICSKTFVSPTYLVAHKQKMHYEELGMEPIKCTECDMILPSNSILKYHIKKVHKKEFKYSCETCGKGFLFASSLRNHKAVHSTDRNEVCPFCGAAYVHPRVLVDHLKNHHPEEYAAQKGIDPSKIPQPSVNNQGPFFCKFCNMEFSMRWALLSHLKTHREVYDKNKCEICGKSYTSQAGLKRHEESAHVSDIYSCENCGKDFSCRDYLRYHLKNHCKKQAGPGNDEAAFSAHVEDKQPVAKAEINDTDPHGLNESAQLLIVTTTSLAQCPNPSSSSPPCSGEPLE